MHPPPTARRDQLVLEQAGDELLVYDGRTGMAHQLNRTAAAVFRLSDGTRDARDLARDVAAEIGGPADEDLVLLALDELGGAGLLEQPLDRDAEESRRSRQRLLAHVAALASPTGERRAPPPRRGS